MPRLRPRFRQEGPVAFLRGPRAVEDHFRGKDPLLERIFERLLSRLRQLGPVRVDAVQSSINLIHGHHFGGVTVKKDRLLPSVS